MFIVGFNLAYCSLLYCFSFPHCQLIDAMICSGYKVLQVINGSSDAYVHTTRIKKWDICAGNAILSAVGGQMTTLTGQSLDYGDTQNAQNNDGLLATLNEHQKFLNIFSSAFKKRKT